MSPDPGSGPGPEGEPTAKARGRRLVTVLWFVAAGLAIVALTIAYLNDREIKWPQALLALWAIVMGVISARRK